MKEHLRVSTLLREKGNGHIVPRAVYPSNAHKVIYIPSSHFPSMLGYAHRFMVNRIDRGNPPAIL